MIKLLFILSLVLLFILFKHQEKFLNPNTILKRGSIKKMRAFRECRPNNIKCILKNQPIVKLPIIPRPTFIRRVNYLVSKDVRHLFPPSKPIRRRPVF